MGRALIITGGPVSDALTVPKHEVCIAADSGFCRAAVLGVFPDYIVGDFDSVGDAFTGAYTDPATGRESIVIRYPAKKDDTDTMIAAELAVNLGYTDVTIVGGLGGRADHTLSSVLFVENLARRGISATLTDGENEVRILRAGECAHIPCGTFRYFSLIALEDSTVTVSGCAYPLNCAVLTRDNPYAISNEASECGADVRCHAGTLLLIRSERL